MTSPTTQRFTVTDGMVLIAATALGLAAVRELSRLALSTFGTDAFCSDLVDLSYSVAFCLSLAWTFALLLLRLRRPRPGRRDLFRQPGFAACVAVTLTATLHVMRTLTDAAYSVVKDSMMFRNFLSVSVASKCIDNLDEVGLVFAPVVLSVWTIQGLAGVWEPEASWIDRGGRILGLFWVASVAGLAPIYWLRSGVGG
ncbi:MAG: hypothetical protein LC745_12540 [Planctomycetia bacterium]|nr:hypothetical protein [Planctomycetia bacterium]